MYKFTQSIYLISRLSPSNQLLATISFTLISLSLSLFVITLTYLENFKIQALNSKLLMEQSKSCEGRKENHSPSFLLVPSALCRDFSFLYRAFSNNPPSYRVPEPPRQKFLFHLCLPLSEIVEGDFGPERYVPGCSSVIRQE